MTNSEIAALPIQTNGKVPTEANDIDQVRDVLFGSHAREFERRFRTNERRIDELGAAIQRLAERFEREVAEIQTSIRQQHVQTMMRVEDVNRVAQERTQSHQRETGQRFDSLHVALNEMTDLLDRTKLDQEQMGDLLVDLGGRLKRAAKEQMAAHQRTNDEQNG